MMDRLWSIPPHTLGIFNPACCATSTNCTGDGMGFEVAALTSVGSLHCHSGVVRASISVLPNRNKDEPRKRRRGKFISCDYRGTDQLQRRNLNRRSRRCIQYFQSLYDTLVLRLDAKQILQNCFCFFLIIPQRVESSKIEIGLIETRHNPDASLELLLCLHVILLPYEENAEIVQGFGIIRQQFDCLLQI